MKRAHAFNVNLETNSFSLEQTTSSDFEPLYGVASNPVVWEQHPEKDRWKRSVFLTFFQGALENDLGCFTIRDKSAGVVIGSTRFYSHDAAGEALLSHEYLHTTYIVEINDNKNSYLFAEQIKTRRVGCFQNRVDGAATYYVCMI